MCRVYLEVTVQSLSVQRVNHACMNEHAVQAMSGAPVYEQS